MTDDLAGEAGAFDHLPARPRAIAEGLAKLSPAAALRCAEGSAPARRPTPAAATDIFKLRESLTSYLGWICWTRVSISFVSFETTGELRELAAWHRLSKPC